MCMNLNIYASVILTHRDIKHADKEQAYNELTLNIVKWFSFPVGLKHFIEDFLGITSYVYNIAKSPIPGTSI